MIAGVLLIGTLGSALRLAGITSDIINVITGVLLILSVVSASLLAWLHQRRAAAVGRRKGRQEAERERVATTTQSQQPPEAQTRAQDHASNSHQERKNR